MTTLRVGEAWLWPDPFAGTDLSVIGGHYRDAFTRPPKFDATLPAFEWDGDRWQINVIGHGLLGSELYVRSRLCGHDALVSLVFTTAASAVWEYGFEANGVRPSGLDLVLTPSAGIALGEFRYWAWVHARALTPLLRHAIRFVVDPLGQFERRLGSAC
jgi:hypothetical protein